jgi:DNA-binding SARP family transcriptional activator
LSTPTSSRAPSHSEGRQRLGSALEALIGLAALAALTIGIPLALWFLGGWPLPHGLQGPEQLGQALLRPIPDAFWVKALISLTWLYWLHFMVCLIAEAIAAARGRVALRVPAGRLNQAVAARLIGAILVLAPISTPLHAAAAAVPPVHIGAITATTIPSVSRDHSQLARSSTPARGNGAPDSPRDSAPHRAAGELQSYTVRHWTPGQRRDTLWSIAEKYLHDELGRPAPQRWPEIFRLNRGRALPDPPGGIFTDPHWIFPGQQLLLPADAVQLPAAPAAPSPAPRSNPQSHAPTTTSPITSPSTSQNPTGPNGRPGTSPTLPAAPPDTKAEPVMSELARVVAALAGGGLLAAGIVATLASLRRVQQHRRRHGRRIKLPTGDAASIEMGLRAAQEPEQGQRVDLALRALSGAIRRADLPAPSVQAAFVGAAGIDLLLGRAAPAAPPPFILNGPPDRWQLPANVEDIELAGLAGGVPPLPGLVTIGHAGQDRLLLNLEHAGLLTIAGPTEETTGLLAAMATELATSLWSGHLDLVLVGFGDELAPLAQVRRAERLETILPDLERRLDRVRRLSEAGEHGTALAARIASPTPDSWNPTIVLCADRPDSDALDQLLRLTSQQGPTPLGAAVPGEHVHSEWHLELTGHGGAQLSPLGLELRAQVLTAEAYQAIGKLLATAADTHDVAPDEPPYDSLEPQIPKPPGGRPHLTLVSGEESDAPARSEDQGELVPSNAKEVRVLGKIHVHGVPVIERRKSLELIVYLALHPQGADAERIWEALWPERPVNRGTLHTTVSTARNRLGEAGNGTPYLPDASEGVYRLHPELGLDWARFQTLTSLAEESGSKTIAALRQALELVTGNPLESATPRAYDWALVHRTEIEATVGEVAERLASLYLDADDHRHATWAARQGLLASPYDERLYRQLMLAADAAGNSAGIDATMRELVHVMGDELEPLDDLHPETIKLYQQLRGKRPIPT